jgi:hypothetical protein
MKPPRRITSSTPKKSSTSSRAKAPRTAMQYKAMPERQRRTWDKVVNVLRKMRDRGGSLQRASQEAEVSPATVKRWIGSTLRKKPGGKWGAELGDSFLRPLQVLTPEGRRDALIVGSRRASLLSKYWSALHRYLESGDDSGLRKFRGKSLVDASGVSVLFVTDRITLKRLGAAGILSFESIYWKN